MEKPVSQGEAEEIPNRLYFRIGDVSRLAGIKPHVLRYWETEFPELGPKKSGAGQRLYRRKDVEMVLEIKRLLYDNRFTIEGARKHLGQRGRRAAKAAAPRRIQRELFLPIEIAGIRKELEDILELLR